MKEEYVEENLRSMGEIEKEIEYLGGLASLEQRINKRFLAKTLGALGIASLVIPAIAPLTAFYAGFVGIPLAEARLLRRRIVGKLKEKHVEVARILEESSKEYLEKLEEFKKEFEKLPEKEKEERFPLVEDLKKISEWSLSKLEEVI